MNTEGRAKVRIHISKIIPQKYFPVFARVRIQAPYVFAQKLIPQDFFPACIGFVPGGNVQARLMKGQEHASMSTLCPSDQAQASCSHDVHIMSLESGLESFLAGRSVSHSLRLSTNQGAATGGRQKDFDHCF